MAGKTPGSTRKSTSRKKATAKQAPSVTPIDQNLSSNQTAPEQASLEQASLDQTSRKDQNSTQNPISSHNQTSLEDQNSSQNPISSHTQNSPQNQTSSYNQSSPQNQASSQNSIHPVATNAAKDTAAKNHDETPSRGAEPMGGRAMEPTVLRPSHSELVEQIRARAYELFEQRGRLEGFDQQDWAQAEAEVMARLQREKSA